MKRCFAVNKTVTGHLDLHFFYQNKNNCLIFRKFYSQMVWMHVYVCVFSQSRSHCSYICSP